MVPASWPKSSCDAGKIATALPLGVDVMHSAVSPLANNTSNPPTETIAYEDFVKFGGEQGAKDAGKMRAEGKEYVVKDGDVMNFLFSS